MQFLDLVYKRYASPFDYLDRMLKVHRFREAIVSIVDAHNKEKEDDALWQLWLHKVIDKSYNDWLRSVKAPEAPQTTDDDIVATINASAELLNSFDPNNP